MSKCVIILATIKSQRCAKFYAQYMSYWYHQEAAFTNRTQYNDITHIKFEAKQEAPFTDLFPKIAKEFLCSVERTRNILLNLHTFKG